MVVKIILKNKKIGQESNEIKISSGTNSPGSYAVSSVETRPWASTNVVVSKPKTRRAKPDPIVINPIFKECLTYVKDPTWETIFTDASFGKLPRGFTYKDGYITHKIRNKVSRIEISPIAAEAVTECINFFREKAGIMSQDDQKKAKQEFEDFLLNSGALCPNRWSEIRKKKIKDVLISTFIARLTKELGLSNEEKADLRNKIYLGFILGCFGNEQVELCNGYIHAIAGLRLDPDSRKFNINYTKAPKQLKKSRRVEKINKPKQSFYTLWVKFLETLEKRAVKSGNISAVTSQDEMLSPNDETESPVINTDA